jgi:predicted restriction endonuclease
MTTFFDEAFAVLGADFKTTARCSWSNYQGFVGILGEVRIMLGEALGTDVTLLDAHSFAWILVNQMKDEEALADTSAYQKLPASEKDALVKARIGQGRFRDELISYWSTCAVTGCKEKVLLTASHIKPWAGGTTAERLDVFNGLLLSPALDCCFDCGLISFADDGKILISERLDLGDKTALGISANMRLRTVDLKHRPYLAFHRKHIFLSK